MTDNQRTRLFVATRDLTNALSRDAVDEAALLQKVGALQFELRTVRHALAKRLRPTGLIL